MPITNQDRRGILDRSTIVSQDTQINTRHGANTPFVNIRGVNNEYIMEPYSGLPIKALIQDFKFTYEEGKPTLCEVTLKCNNPEMVNSPYLEYKAKHRITWGWLGYPKGAYTVKVMCLTKKEVSFDEKGVTLKLTYRDSSYFLKVSVPAIPGVNANAPTIGWAIKAAMGGAQLNQYSLINAKEVDQRLANKMVKTAASPSEVKAALENGTLEISNETTAENAKGDMLYPNIRTDVISDWNRDLINWTPTKNYFSNRNLIELSDYDNAPNAPSMYRKSDIASTYNYNYGDTYLFSYGSGATRVTNNNIIYHIFNLNNQVDRKAYEKYKYENPDAIFEEFNQIVKTASVSYYKDPYWANVDNILNTPTLNLAGTTNLYNQINDAFNKNVPGGPWYIDCDDDNIIIHNDMDNNPVSRVYTYWGGFGEMLEFHVTDDYTQKQVNKGKQSDIDSEGKLKTSTRQDLTQASYSGKLWTSSETRPTVNSIGQANMEGGYAERNQEEKFSPWQIFLMTQYGFDAKAVIAIGREPRDFITNIGYGEFDQIETLRAAAKEWWITENKYLAYKRSLPGNNMFTNFFGIGFTEQDKMGIAILAGTPMEYFPEYTVNGGLNPNANTGESKTNEVDLRDGAIDASDFKGTEIAQGGINVKKANQIYKEKSWDDIRGSLTNDQIAKSLLEVINRYADAKVTMEELSNMTPEEISKKYHYDMNADTVKYETTQIVTGTAITKDDKTTYDGFWEPKVQIFNDYTGKEDYKDLGGEITESNLITSTTETLDDGTKIERRQYKIKVNILVPFNKLLPMFNPDSPLDSSLANDIYLVTTNRQKATAKVLGDPGLRSSMVIKVQNVSHRYSKDWYVKKVTHTISANVGYICDIDFREKVSSTSQLVVSAESQVKRVSSMLANAQEYQKAHPEASKSASARKADLEILASNNNDKIQEISYRPSENLYTSDVYNYRTCVTGNENSYIPTGNTKQTQHYEIRVNR